MSHTYIPIVVTSTLWIIPSIPQTLGSTMKTICPDEATTTESLQQPFHMLRLSPACSATSRLQDYSMLMNVSLDPANIETIKISTPK